MRTVLCQQCFAEVSITTVKGNGCINYPCCCEFDGTFGMATYSPERASPGHRAQLWDAINEYAEACGGTPGDILHGNTKRQRAVSEIEELVYPTGKN